MLVSKDVTNFKTVKQQLKEKSREFVFVFFKAIHNRYKPESDKGHWQFEANKQFCKFWAVSVLSQTLKS